MHTRVTAGHFATIETRGDGQKVVSGYAAVFYRAGDAGTEYQLWDNLYERIDTGAFSRAISERQDVRGLFNHDPDHLLGRTASNTLRLSVDERGLRYEIDLPDTQAGRDVAVSLSRGDLTGSSFSFIPRAVSWADDNGREIRTIDDVDLFDVGPVTFPAYQATSAGMRAAGETEEIEESRKLWIDEKAKLDAVQSRNATKVRATLANLH
jgi:uncharacterized protein